MAEAKTALVTGGAGFIGSHLVDRLILMGYRVVIFDDLSTGKLKNVNQAAAFHHVDITNAAQVKEAYKREQPDLIFHLAAQISVSQSTRDPARDAEINVLGTVHLLEAARQFGVEKIIYSSTGGALYGDPQCIPCRENDPIVPISPYGQSKYAAEQYLDLYHRLHRLDYTILRYGNVYGPRQDPHGEAGVVAIFAKAMLEGRQPQIFGDGGQERDFVYVGDVVEANILAISKGKNEAFNIGTGQGASINDLFKALKSATGYKWGPEMRKARPGDVYRISLECSKAAQVLGWKAQTALADGLTQTVEYFRSRVKVAP